ncbi:hypothetical protein ACIRPR_33605 [Streptomyces griseoflavus]|uniref:hypothetical protein n=1 Tax=Streptomyces griseoflavus TaxID=35619 RepID=UPI003823D71F
MTTLPLIVVLALSGVGVYAAYRNPKLGAALLVGIGILTGLYIVLEKDPGMFPTDGPPSSTAPVQVPNEGLPVQQVPMPSVPETVPPAGTPSLSP